MFEDIKITKPDDIEKKSFEIIGELLSGREIFSLHGPIIKRVVHTTADLEYADIIKISENAVENAITAIKAGSNVVTDTKMAAAGINKKMLNKFGGDIICHMSDEDIVKEAAEKGITRAWASMDKASVNNRNRIYAIGNAPTALIRLCDLIKKEIIKPDVVIGVPVGFVNVVESKKMLKKSGVPYIISEGRKGGSNVAAAIVNAIIYMIER